MTTNKKIIIYIFISITIIQLFTLGVTVIDMIAAYNNPNITIDFTPLTTLITSVVGEVGAYGIYRLKSMKENTEGGITYLNAQYELENNNEEED